MADSHRKSGERLVYYKEPVITINSKSVIFITKDTTFVDPCVTAVDKTDRFLIK